MGCVIAKVKNCESFSGHWMAEAANAFISVNKMTIKKGADGR